MSAFSSLLRVLSVSGELELNEHDEGHFRRVIDFVLDKVSQGHLRWMIDRFCPRGGLLRTFTLVD